jgi:hypothetical protein
MPDECIDDLVLSSALTIHSAIVYLLVCWWASNFSIHLINSYLKETYCLGIAAALFSTPTLVSVMDPAIVHGDLPSDCESRKSEIRPPLWACCKDRKDNEEENNDRIFLKLAPSCLF